MQLSLGYHCTRVKDPTDQDYSKFRHLTRLSCATWFIPLIIYTDDKGEVVTHVDGAHAVHADGKGHSGNF